MPVRNHSVFDKDNFTFSIAIDTILEEFKYHPSVINIKKHPKQAKCFSFSEATTADVLKLIKRININKAMGEDQIPPKLIKTAGSFLAESLTDSCFSASTFPVLVKRVLVTPIDKGDTYKHIYTNYRLASVLNSFLKIIESFKCDQLAKYANEFLQTFKEA